MFIRCYISKQPYHTVLQEWCKPLTTIMVPWAALANLEEVAAARRGVLEFMTTGAEAAQAEQVL